jgi:hypothetical protein
MLSWGTILIIWGIVTTVILIANYKLGERNKSISYINYCQDPHNFCLICCKDCPITRPGDVRHCENMCYRDPKSCEYLSKIKN